MSAAGLHQSTNIAEDCSDKQAAIIGGGPAGLMAAEILAGAGATVDVYESMPTLGRKFLRAGLGGLNITHSEPFDAFCSRYDDRQASMQPFLDGFPPDALRKWVHELGIETFVGTSGRVFPKEMKAAPLLRMWVHRLRAQGVRFHLNHRWLGFCQAERSGQSSEPALRIFGQSEKLALRIANRTDEFTITPEVVILALGGASWPQLGSAGTWVSWLEERGVKVVPWQSANCGFDVDWSAHMREKFPGVPLKAVSLTFTGLDGVTESREGELLIREYGIEGSLVYAFSKKLREFINARGKATFTLDLLPGRSADRVLKELSSPRGSKSMSRYLQKCLGDNALKRTLLFEILSKEQMEDPSTLAKFVKALPITVQRPRPIEEVISSAGGVAFDSLDENLMLKALPGIFVAGEMIDWEAPTGGYLLTGCLSTGRWAAIGAAKWLQKNSL